MTSGAQEKDRMIARQGNTRHIHGARLAGRTVAENPEASCACLNAGEAVCPERIRTQSVCLNQDIAEVLARLR